MDKSSLLSESKEGQVLTVTNITNEEITWQALRFGLEEGSQIRIEKNIHGGPVIVSKNNLEIAIGRKIAESIETRVTE